MPLEDADVRFTAVLTRRLHMQLKQAALEERRSATALVRDAILLYLNQRRERARRMRQESKRTP